MRRAALLCLASMTVLAAASVAQASDASLEHALAAYQSKLTTDIGYLASFATPSRATAAATLSRLSTAQRDLTAADKAASGQQASSATGRQGRTLILSALGEASAAAADGRAAASAARTGNSSAAKAAAARERGAIDAAIPDFEQGGKDLHLF